MIPDFLELSIVIDINWRSVQAFDAGIRISGEARQELDPINHQIWRDCESGGKDTSYIADHIEKIASTCEAPSMIFAVVLDPYHFCEAILQGYINVIGLHEEAVSGTLQLVYRDAILETTDQWIWIRCMTEESLVKTTGTGFNKGGVALLDEYGQRLHNEEGEII